MIKCWACLKETDLYKDNRLDSQSRDTMFEECFKIRPTASTPLCSDCARLLIAAHDFYKLCESSCITIKRYIEREESHRSKSSSPLPSSPDTKRVIVKEEKGENETSSDRSHECSVCYKVFRSWVALAKHCKRRHEKSDTLDRLLTSRPDVSVKRLSFEDWERQADSVDSGGGYFDSRTSPAEETMESLEKSIKIEPVDDIFDDITVDENILAAIKSDEEEKPLITLKLDASHNVKRKVGRPRTKNILISKSGGKKFPCSNCTKSCSSETSLKTHMKSHGLYACRKCDETFSKSSLLKKHMQSDHGISTIKNVCISCGEKFLTSEELEKHDCRVNETKPFICEYESCHYRFAEEEHLRQHLLYHKDGHKNPKVAFCPVCGKGFTTTKYLETHARMHNGDTTFSCKICSKTFNSKCHLREHAKWHSTERPFLCSECGKRFVRNDYLIIHMRRHNGEKPYKCKYCNKGFPRSTDLNVHERYHTGEKAHLCTVCGKGFQRHYNLTVHLRVHTGEKPYVCSYCGKCFAQGNDLKSHVRRHTGERYNCELCGEGFIQGYHLTQHKRSVHGIECNSFTGRLNKHPSGDSQIIKPKKKSNPESREPLLTKQEDKISVSETTDDSSEVGEKVQRENILQLSEKTVEVKIEK